MQDTGTNNERLRQLFRQIANDSSDAFHTVVDTYWNILYSQALVYLKDAHHAQDIVQDIFLQLWQNRRKLSSIDNPEGYLFIATRNRIIDSFRKKITYAISEDMEQGIAEMSPQPDNLLNKKQLESLIHIAVDNLPPQQRRVFELSRQQGLKHEEIAEKLGIARETVKVHMVKALAFIRKFVSSQLILLIAWLMRE